MFPNEFAYTAPTSVTEVLDALAKGPEGEVKILAGGQSLLPMMKLRLASPATLIDLAHVGELHGIHEEGDRLVIGATTTYFQAIESHLVQRHCPLIIEALHQVGDPQVRSRGTIGGSLAHADPAGDLPAVAQALEAEMTLRSANGERRIAAESFFTDLLTTAMEPTEVLTAVRFRSTDQPRTGTAYQKHRHPASGYAVVGVAAVVRLAEDGTCAEARIGITGAGSHATRARSTEQALTGSRLDPAGIEQACGNITDGVELLGDNYASEEYRAQLLRVLARRAVAKAAERARG